MFSGTKTVLVMVTQAISFYRKKGMQSVAPRRALEKVHISFVVENNHSLNHFLDCVHFHDTIPSTFFSFRIFVSGRKYIL